MLPQSFVIVDLNGAVFRDIVSSCWGPPTPPPKKNLRQGCLRPFDSLPHWGTFVSFWVDGLILLTCYLLFSSSSLSSLFFSPFLPWEAAKNSFPQTVKSGGENVKSRYQSCLDLVHQSWLGLDVRVLKNPSELLFFFWRGRTCEKLWHARVYRCVTVLEAFWLH